MKWEYKHSLAFIYAVVLFLDRLDLTIVNVTLPTVAHYFNTSIIRTDWINLAFLLALAISIPISSWLGQRFGLKKIFIIAMLLFGLSSTLCAIAPSLAAINILRFIQGIGGGMLIPTGMTLVYQAYDPSEYASITSFTFLPSLIAPAIAPFLGGLMLDAFGWRMVFLFSGPITLILVYYAITIIKDNVTERLRKPLDWLGFILISLALMDLFLTLSVIARTGFSFNILMSGFGFMVLLILFIRWQQKYIHALFDLSLFNNSSFVKANLIQLCFQIVHFGSIFLIGMYLQVGIGISATLTGLMMGMQAFGAMATNRFSVKLFNEYGIKKPVVWGLGGIAILSPAILLITSVSMVWLGIILFFIRGLFSGLCGAPIQTLSVITFTKDHLSQANSIFNACRQVAISLGIALSSIIIGYGLKLNHIHTSLIANSLLAWRVFGLGFLTISLIAILGIYITQHQKKRGL